MQFESLVNECADAATMQIIRWLDGNFGMAAHHFDGDMLTGEVVQVHRSPTVINWKNYGWIYRLFVNIIQ